jgi:hypothetical protein
MEDKQYNSCKNTLKNVFTKLSNYSSCKNLISQDFYNRITEQDEPLPTENIKAPEKDLLICELDDNSILNDDLDINNLKTPKECENTDQSKTIQFDDSFARECRAVSTKSSVDKFIPIKTLTKPKFNIPIPLNKPKSSSLTAREPKNSKTVSFNRSPITTSRPVSRSKTIISEDDTIMKELQSIFGDNMQYFDDNSKYV